MRTPLILWLLLLAILTLTPVRDVAVDGAAASPDLLCLLCGPRAVADGLLNVALFVPLGWLGSRRWGMARTVAAAATLSLAVEIAQWWIPGRFPGLNDVVWNAAGAGVGAWLPGRTRWARRVLPVGAVLAVLAPAFLLAPAPPDGTYYGQWTAEFGDMAHYEGRVLQAAVAGIDVPSRRSRRSRALRAALGRDGPVEVTFVAGPPPSSLAPVFSIFDHRRRRLFLLGVDGTDVAVDRWTRATTLRLDSPALWWPGAMAGVSPGDTVAIRFAPGDDGPCLTLNRRIECDTAIGADAGWTLLASPGGPVPGLNRVVGFLWMTALGAVVGVAPWSTAVRLGVAGTMMGLAVALPAILPHLGLSAFPALALAAGAAIGLLIGRGTGSS